MISQKSGKNIRQCYTREEYIDINKRTELRVEKVLRQNERYLVTVHGDKIKRQVRDGKSAKCRCRNETGEERVKYTAEYRRHTACN
jgi:hypothetical protein